MKVINTYHADMLNGTGLREVIFVSGCEHHCPGCFNPETWNPDAPGAHEWTEDDWQNLAEHLSKPYIAGVTFSGGDPMFPSNREGVYKLCQRIKQEFPTKTIWLYTGYKYEELLVLSDFAPKILDYVDVLCDGKFVENLKSPKKPWVGSENQRVIDVKQSTWENVVFYKQ